MLKNVFCVTDEASLEAFKYVCTSAHISIVNKRHYTTWVGCPASVLGSNVLRSELIKNLKSSKILLKGLYVIGETFYNWRKCKTFLNFAYF